jgi:hypothetical protein
MLSTFEVYELYIYFGFMRSLEKNEDYDVIYQTYRENINKNNQKLGQYIYDIATTSCSDVTFDSGFDLFNIDKKMILGKQTNLIDFNVNCSLKLKKFLCDNDDNHLNKEDNSIILDYKYDKTFNIFNFVNYLNHKKGFGDSIPDKKGFGDSIPDKKGYFIKNTFDAFSGYYLYPRSSMGLKTPLRCANSVGIIDSGYRGNIKGCLTNTNEMQFELNSRERYMQICPANITYPMVITEVDSLEELGNTTRGSGGFGSTGTN